MSQRQWGNSVVEIRLTGDRHWQFLRSAGRDGGGPLHEEPWCFADLTGKNLEVRFPKDLSPLHGAEFVTSSIYSVRCAPVKPEHIPILNTKRHSPMIYINDGFGIFYHAREPGPHIVHDALARFAESDWDTAAFGNIGGDLVNFPTRAGTRAGMDGWCFERPGDRRCASNLRAMLEAGHDPMKQAIDQAHAQGQVFWMYLRPQAYSTEPPYDHILHSRFYSENPEYRCVEANGKPISKLSIAYPAVRDNLNSILRDALDRGADGLCLAFVRGYPCVRYEAPVLEKFKQLHGVDARTLPDSDEKLRALWTEFVTVWIREIRQMLDKAGPGPKSRRRELSVIVGPDREWNMRFGYDTGAWAREGLVDVVMPYPYTKDGVLDVQYFAGQIKGTKARLQPSFGTFNQNVTVAVLRQRALTCYKEGAHGLSRWDTPSYLARLRFDDPEQQRLWVEEYFPPQNIDMLEFAGFNLEAFGPMLGF